MTVSSTNRLSGPFAGDDTTTELPFDFVVIAASDVAVIVADAEGAETTLTLDSDYTVALNENQDEAPGGTVTLLLPLATDTTAVVTSDVGFVQSVSIPSLSGFYPTVIERALDKLTIKQQEIQRDVERSLKLPITSGDTADQIVASVYSAASSAAASATEAGTQAGLADDARVLAETAQAAAETAQAGAEDARDIAIAALPSDMRYSRSLASAVIDRADRVVSGMLMDGSAYSTVDTGPITQVPQQQPLLVHKNTTDARNDLLQFLPRNVVVAEHFARLSALPSGFTFTRSGEAAAYAADKSLSFVATGAPRFDHDEYTGKPLGIRIEAAHQSYVRNAIAAGSTAGVIGSGGALPTNWTTSGTGAGVTYEVIGVVTVKGIPCLRVKLSGTAASNTSYIISAETGSSNPAVAATGEAWVASAFLTMSAGSMTGVANLKVGISERNSSGTLLAQGGNVVAAALMNAGYFGRFTYNRTLTQATVGRVTPTIIVEVNSGNSIDITLDIGLPNISKAASVSSPAKDDSALAAESLSYAYSTALSSGEIVISAVSPLSGATTLFQLHDGTANNTITASRDAAGELYVKAKVAGVETASLNVGRWGNDLPGVLAVRFGSTGVQACFNGRAVYTDADAAPTGLTTALIGSDLSGNYWGGTVARFWTLSADAADLRVRTAPNAAHDDFKRADGAITKIPYDQLDYELVRFTVSASAVREAVISSNALVPPSAAAESTTGVTAAYTGVNLGVPATRVVVRASFGAGTTNRGNVTLIANPHGLDEVADITNGSIHITFTDTTCQVSVFEAGVLAVLQNIAYAQLACDGVTQYQFGWRSIGNDFYLMELPNGSYVPVYQPRLTAQNGQYATWEHYYFSDGPAPKMYEVYAA